MFPSITLAPGTSADTARTTKNASHRLFPSHAGIAANIFESINPTSFPRRKYLSIHYCGPPYEDSVPISVSYESSRCLRQEFFPQSRIGYILPLLGSSTWTSGTLSCLFASIQLQYWWRRPCEVQSLTGHHFRFRIVCDFLLSPNRGELFFNFGQTGRIRIDLDHFIRTRHAHLPAINRDRSEYLIHTRTSFHTTESSLTLDTSRYRRVDIDTNTTPFSLRFWRSCE